LIFPTFIYSSLVEKGKKEVTWHGHNFHNAKTEEKKFLVGVGAGVLQLIVA
jgi:hypothetical protein